MATFDQFILSLEQDYGEQGKGKPFEVFCKWFLENDPEWSKTVDKVWLWDDYPNKWQRQDLGTDLVFRDNDGLVWAVQAKCYGEHRTTTKGDMDSFLNDMGRTGIDRGLWMQSNPLVGINAKHSLEDRDKQVLVLDLDRFRDAPLEYPASFADLYEAKVKEKPKPDPHQIKAIEDATAGLKTSDRGQMIMACGTGKTFTTLWIKEALEADTTLVLLPSLSLLSQTMWEWAWAGNTDFDILNVCSDTTVGTKNKPEDMKVSDVSIPVTSKVEKIIEFLKQPKPKVIFCTYQSSDLIAQAQLDDAVPTFNLAVADEAHRCAGKADAGFATILDGEKIRASKRLFTTATPRYFGKAIKDEAKARDLAVVGMDDEAIFGPVIHKLTFGQAIEQELLTDYQVVIVGVDEPMVREWIENYEIVSTDPDNQTDARTLAAKIGMLKAVKDYDLKRVISFHSRVAGAKQFSDELVDVANLIEPANRPEGTFLSDYVSGAMKAGDRKKKIDRLKVLEGYDRGILTNARCLAEGVDVPSLDGVAFIDPRGSQVEIIQAVGRAIRKVRGAAVQKKGTIVLPVFIEDGDDHEASIEASNFKPVWDVLKALRAHDGVLADTLDQYRTNMAKNVSQSRESINDKIIFDMPVSVDVAFSSALRTVLVEASTESWEFWFGLLEQFKEAEGHCKVPDRFKLDGYGLGSWVGNQRAKQGSLPSERKQRLDDIGFIWAPHTTAWEEGYQKLLSFSINQGHSKVPTKFLCDDGFQLGSWVDRQRQSLNIMSAKRVSLLSALPEWSWNSLDAKWNTALAALQQFCETAELYKLKKNHITEDGIKLGKWLRIQFANKKNISSDRKDLLEAIPGWDWSLKGMVWKHGYSRLCMYVATNEGELPTQSYMDNDFKLGSWVQQQRTYKSGLSLKQVSKLEEISGWFWLVSEKTDRNFVTGRAEIIRFMKRYGHSRVPQKYVTNSGFKLGVWLSNIRVKRKSLPIEIIEDLQRIDGWSWSPREDSWNFGIASLIKFSDEFGHAAPPTTYIDKDGYKLGAWVSECRTSKTTFSHDRITFLEDLPGWVWNAMEAKWLNDISEFEAYVKNFKTAKVLQSYVSPTGFKLGLWCKGIRRRKNKITPARIKTLDSLGFIWNTQKDKT